MFTTAPYVRSRHPQSVLCAPILYQSRLTGILYLENRLLTGAFSSDRLKMMKLLASQIAISIENAVEGLYQTTPHGQVISANPAMARILGYDSPKKLMESVKDIGRDIYVSERARQEFIRLMEQNRVVSGYEVEFHRKDGTRIWASLHGRPVYDDNGKLKLIDGIMTDITRRKQETDALREREEYLRKENLRLRSDIKDRYKFGGIIGKSVAMQKIYELILRAAAGNANVIVYGESGTGKELVSKAIHDMSDRRSGRFVPVNIGAIPEHLLESEFFGYEKGAFTGANGDKQGFLDLAHQGTLFLDEMGEINLNIQVKLLRALEGGGYTPVGGKDVKKPDIRIIAATNRDLHHLVEKGLMREDFYYRIHIVPIHLPPLRERKDDIPLLVEHFTQEYGNNMKLPPVTGDILESLHAHNWPGNVRELRNVLHRYFTLNQFDLIKSPAKKALKIFIK